MTPIAVVNEYCFHNWSNRHTYLNLEDMAESLNIEVYYSHIPSNLSTIMILKYLEFASNIVMLCDTKIFEEVSNFDYYTDDTILDENMEIALEHLNFSKYEINYEGMKSNIKVLNSKLDDDIGFMLNNINIRHNNKSGKSKKEYVSKMRKDTMEKWYDETYQMLLLAFLLNEQPNRSKKISHLKEKLK